MFSTRQFCSLKFAMCSLLPGSVHNKHGWCQPAYWEQQSSRYSEQTCPMEVSDRPSLHQVPLPSLGLPDGAAGDPLPLGPPYLHIHWRYTVKYPVQYIVLYTVHSGLCLFPNNSSGVPAHTRIRAINQSFLKLSEYFLAEFSSTFSMSSIIPLLSSHPLPVL